MHAVVFSGCPLSTTVRLGDRLSRLEASTRACTHSLRGHHRRRDWGHRLGGPYLAHLGRFALQSKEAPRPLPFFLDSSHDTRHWQPLYPTVRTYLLSNMDQKRVKRRLDPYPLVSKQSLWEKRSPPQVVRLQLIVAFLGLFIGIGVIIP